MSKLLKREPLPSELPGLGDDRYVVMADVPQAESGIRKLPVNQASLRKAWDTQPRSTKDDWADWIRRLCLEMLKETPSHALRACADMANSYHPLARELFNAAFVSCWSELLDQYQVREYQKRENDLLLRIGSLTASEYSLVFSIVS